MSDPVPDPEAKDVITALTLEPPIAPLPRFSPPAFLSRDPQGILPYMAHDRFLAPEHGPYKGTTEYHGFAHFWLY